MSKATSNANIASSNNTGTSSVNTNALSSFGMGIKMGAKRNTNTEEVQHPVVQ
jgi:hypothetical protein